MGNTDPCGHCIDHDIAHAILGRVAILARSSDRCLGASDADAVDTRHIQYSFAVIGSTSAE